MCPQVRDYLFAQADLNLTRSDEATPASNVIYLMELQPPPKVPALAFLDSGGVVPPPPRQACICGSTNVIIQIFSLLPEMRILIQGRETGGAAQEGSTAALLQEEERAGGRVSMLIEQSHLYVIPQIVWLALEWQNWGSSFNAACRCFAAAQPCTCDLITLQI